MPTPTAELTRLSTSEPTGYGNGDYNASTNPFGFGNGGHRINLYALTLDVTVVANWVAELAEPLVAIVDDISALADVDAEIVALAALTSQLTALGAITANITTAAGIAANITTVAGKSSELSTLAPRAPDIGLLADIEDGTTATGAITTVAANATPVINVAANIGDVVIVAAAIAAINTVAGISSAVGTVAGIAGAVGTVATNAAAVSDAAANMAAIIAAPDAAADAAAQAEALMGTSTTAITIGTGTQTFTLEEAARQFGLGNWIMVVSDADPVNDWMLGQVTDYTGDDLELNVTRVNGSGEHTDWTLSISGPEGPANAGTGDVVGPASSTANNLPKFADTTGKLLSDSGIAIANIFNKAADDLDDLTEGTTNKAFTATLKTKLDGIEAAADVTDIGNVASSVHGASGKSTPVDNDEVLVIDSAASNVGKKTLWSEIKATLKTYFDTLYATVSHTHAFSALTSKPTTISGYGITDARVPGAIFGLLLSNNGTDSANDIDISAGSATDSTGAVRMTLGSALTKRGDASWAVGTGNGGMDTGSIANGWNYAWEIMRSDTGVVDALISASATSPTMPSNYDYKRYLGAFYRASGSNVAFYQDPDDPSHFLFVTPRLDINVGNLGTTATEYTVTVPPGKVGDFVLGVFNSGSVGAIYATPTVVTSQAEAPANGRTDLVAAAGANASGNKSLLTSGTSTIRIVARNATTFVTGLTLGWRDARGRFN